MTAEKQPQLLSLDELAKLPSTYAQPAWWKEATIFQIWPASFCDSNGDGIGDIGGILSKVDYLKELGADVVWTSPIYPSPNHDMGYDVADYKDIKKEYGTLADVDRLIAELKKRDMKLVMDLVVNHTSNEHAWFKESSASSSKSNPKKDWYIWRPAKKGPNGERLPPNNWVSFFCGSAWTWCEARQEYYLSLFCPEQPDLNWENPDVREAVQDVMRFWLDRGVAGFRCDVINQISKTYVQDGSEYPPLPDAPVTDPEATYQPATSLFCDGPRVHEFIRELNDKVLSHYDTITVGESPFLEDPKKLLYWTHPDRNELRMNFQFDIVTVDCDPMAPIKPRDWTLPELKLTTNKWQAFCHRHNGWNSNYSCNHDQCRPVSRWLSDAPEVRKQAAKTHALHQITLGGTLYVYQGEELGMKNIPEDWPIEEYQDVMTINYYKECMDALAAGKKDAPSPQTVVKVSQPSQGMTVPDAGVAADPFILAFSCRISVGLHEGARQRPHARPVGACPQRGLHLSHCAALDASAERGCRRGVERP